MTLLIDRMILVKVPQRMRFDKPSAVKDSSYESYADHDHPFGYHMTCEKCNSN
eukprot:CAMPEP_0176348640 /NCGR_PEP_ID=MMETSP0126-20121128/8028_1 /TAXON_ID=141414 ORGANISM="Strombidinopsis acuminatum, Strain SPMC142" /NCGR_SAMPLE_ID=MMETSP0126 /ASSEMBLY_ACC=CAM_ASM_000229 /LENGTH=52 /DNA_ID=CAMNT_0017697555 /DNA_START=197 /DNA_END=355 /DNA_ORIENTATION=-